MATQMRKMEPATENMQVQHDIFLFFPDDDAEQPIRATLVGASGVSPDTA